MTEPRRPALPVLDPSRPAVCRKLRTKLAYGSWEGTGDWRDGDSTTAAYWCLRTMESAGPDDTLSHPHHCGADRPCYAPSDAAGLLAAFQESGADKPA